VSGREADIAAIKVKMTKNKEFNAKERSKMRKTLLAKMAVNAKKAKDDLDAAMSKTVKHFKANVSHI